MVLAMGSSGRYFIVAIVILLIVCVGLYLAYRASTRSADRPRGPRH